MTPPPEEVAALVERLLDHEELHANRDGLLAYRRVPMCEQAAAALTALQARAEAAEARVAELEAALKKIETGTAPEADPDTGELIECWMDADEMREIAIRALDAIRAADPVTKSS